MNGFGGILEFRRIFGFVMIMNGIGIIRTLRSNEFGGFELG